MNSRIITGIVAALALAGAGYALTLQKPSTDPAFNPASVSAITGHPVAVELFTSQGC
ncbi:hypothetical protein ACNI3Q_01970 [Sphingomonas sp. FW199]|uniref:hypothetical protein n=1 Tax=Sphingomonas sp. FW199 TaxID=3400217 RepID=UPI003CED7F80